MAKISKKVLNTLKRHMTLVSQVEGHREPAFNDRLVMNPKLKLRLDNSELDKSQLRESNHKTAVFTFGRMNPPTVGHQKLVDKIKQVSKSRGGKPIIFLSHTHDQDKNPLEYSEKIKLARTAFGRDVVKPSSAKTIIDVLKKLDQDYDGVVMVVGDDRVNEFKSLLSKYNQKEYSFDSIEVVSAGTRDPDSSDVSGMSASKMRSYVSSGDMDSFKKGLPQRIKSQYKRIFGLLKKNLTEAIVGQNQGIRLAARRNASGAKGAAARRESQAARIAGQDSNDIRDKSEGEAMGIIGMEVMKQIGMKDPESMSRSEMIAASNVYQSKLQMFPKLFDQRLKANMNAEVPSGKAFVKYG